jgi:hypothetical protein
MSAAVLAVCLLGAGKARPMTAEERDAAELHAMLNPKGQVVILAAGKDFVALQREARAMARKAGVAFSLRGMAYDRKNGLHFKDSSDGDSGYVSRRESTTEIAGKEVHFLSIEKSDAYPGLKAGYYIIVADICFDSNVAARAVNVYRPFAPTAYACATRIYMGCRH